MGLHEPEKEMFITYTIILEFIEAEEKYNICLTKRVPEKTKSIIFDFIAF